jgi:hypothetical protein
VYCSLKGRAELFALFDFYQRICDEAVRLAVNRNSGFLVGCFDEAENLARAFVKPVALIIDVVFLLGLQICLMRMRDSISGQPFDVIVDINEQWIGVSLSWVLGTDSRFRV